MQKIKDKIFSLIHITSKKSLNNILSDRHINSSVHDINNCKIQWLGNGIYFWDINDSDAIKLGKNLVRGKYRTECICGIVVNFEVTETKYADLEQEKWSMMYENFLKQTNPQTYEQIIEYMDIIKCQNKVPTETLNKIGKLTGTTLNLFFEYLNDHGIYIDIVSGYFYHKKRKKIIFGRDIKQIQQFCVRNPDLINDCIETWKIKHTI